jgi:hypothetical protein
MLKRIAAVVCLALLLGALPGWADQWNKKTIVTFGEAVELPGIVLPAGTYVFKLADTNYRHVVQVFNADETKILATILAIPDSRLTVTDKSVFRFDERPRNQPEALRRWFYPADSFGHEFVYKNVPLQMAEITPAPVLEEIEIPEAPRVEVVAAAPVIPELPAVPEFVAPTAGEADRVVPELVSAPIPEASVTELPKTASPLPLVALLGVLSLGGAHLLRTRR